MVNPMQGIIVDDTKNSISFNNQIMNMKVPQQVIELYKARVFDTIFVGYKKLYLGTILDDIAKDFQPPTTLNLDLFYGIEDLPHSADLTRKIFSKWEGKGTKVVFRCNAMVLKTFTL